MILKSFEALPEFLKCDGVKPYYDILKKKQASLVFKRMLDIVLAFFLMLLLLLPMLVIAICIKCT